MDIKLVVSNFLNDVKALAVEHPKKAVFLFAAGMVVGAVVW